MRNHTTPLTLLKLFYSECGHWSMEYTVHLPALNGSGSLDSQAELNWKCPQLNLELSLNCVTHEFSSMQVEYIVIHKAESCDLLG